MMFKYLDEFPGMVHFLYVDRTTHRVVGPSINAEMSEIFNPRDPSHYIKQIIWDGWNYIQSFLVQGEMVFLCVEAERRGSSETGGLLF